MSKYFLTVLSLCLLLSFSVNSQAQKWRKEALSVVDYAYMDKQKESINNLIRIHFGRQLTGKQDNDYPLIQRLLNNKIINPQQTEQLQALGVIFGNIFKNKHHLTWTIYIDRYGRSRALNIPRQQDVLFPMTMISRRIEAGAIVDINAIDRKAEETLARIRKQIIVY